MTRKSSPGLMIPHFRAIERAVLILSPVTMRTHMPAFWHLLIASGTCGENDRINAYYRQEKSAIGHADCWLSYYCLTSGLTGSSMPTTQIAVKCETMLASSSQFGSPSILHSFSATSPTKQTGFFLHNGLPSNFQQGK